MNVPVDELFASIRPGDRVTFLAPNGRGICGREWAERTGRAVICPGSGFGIASLATGVVVLNMGGAHGTPACVTPATLIRVGRRIAYPPTTPKNGPR